MGIVPMNAGACGSLGSPSAYEPLDVGASYQT